MTEINNIFLKTLTDEELIKYIQDQKEIEKCWNTISNRYYKKVIKRCENILKNDKNKEDIAHEILIHIFLKIPTFQFKSKFETWLNTVVNNKCIDHLRKTKNIQTTISQEIEDQIEEIIDTDFSELKYNILEKALLSLKPKERAMIQERFLEQKSSKELAIKYNTTSANIKMTLMRIKKKLRTYFENHTTHKN